MFPKGCSVCRVSGGVRIQRLQWPCLTLEQLPSAVAIQSSEDRKSTRLNSSHTVISYAVFCLKKKKKRTHVIRQQKTTASVATASSQALAQQSTRTNLRPNSTTLRQTRRDIPMTRSSSNHCT